MQIKFMHPYVDKFSLKVNFANARVAKIFVWIDFRKPNKKIQVSRNALNVLVRFINF